MKQNFKKAVIFINGDEADLNYVRTYVDQKTLVVGCDGGTDKIYGLGYKPDAVIGDFDSIQALPAQIKNLPKADFGKEILVDGTTYVKYPTDKDFLDVELAINYVVGQKIKELIIVNTEGDELDHVLGVLMVLAKRKYKPANIKIIRPGQEIYTARGKTVIHGKKGDKVSLVPLYGSVNVESSSGLKYDPSKYQMSLHRNIGISNELTSKKATLNTSKGCFLVVHHQG